MTRLPTATARQARRELGVLLAARRGRVVRALAVHVAAGLVGLVGPQLLGALVDSVPGGGASARVDLLGAAFVVVLLAHAALRRAARRRTGERGEDLLAVQREHLVRDALALPLGTVEAAGSGALLSRATTDLDRVDSAVRNALPEIVAATVTVVLTVAAMIVTSPLLALALLVAVPTIGFPTRRLWRRVPRVLEGVLDRWSTLQSRTHESVTGARTADALGSVERRVAAGERDLVAAVDDERRLRSLHARWVPWVELSHTLPVAVMLLIGGWAFATGRVDLGTVTTMVVYAQALGSPVDEALWWTEDLMMGAAAQRRVLGVRAARGPVPPGVGDPYADRAVVTVPHAERGKGGADVEIRGAWFGYAADRAVVRGVDLHVPAGARWAIVGPSGAGKSTLGRLVAGIAAPTAGTVRLGGRDVSAMPEPERRARVLLLTQEQHVFAGTLRENLTLPGARDDATLRAALATVGADAWAATLPDGLDTALGAGARAVPAAVAQQLALARVVLADPQVVVLDEATSLLDPATAGALERSLHGALAGRTAIAIAHRLHVAAAADHVVVMERGGVAEQGTHTELLATGGSYARLWARASG